MDEDLGTFARRVDELLAEDPEMTGRNVQLRIVEPLLSMLGWDVRAPEVEAEWDVDTLEDPIDYVLLVDDRPDVAVRTMAASESIDESGVAVFARGIVSEGIDLGIVSNGRRFAFITTDGTEIKWTLCESETLPEHESILKHFTYAMATQRYAARVEARQRAAARLQENQAVVTEAVARELQSVAGDELDGELRTLSRVILDVAIERFSEGDSPVETETTPPPAIGDPDSADSETDASSGTAPDAPATPDSSTDAAASATGEAEATADTPAGATGEAEATADTSTGATAETDGSGAVSASSRNGTGGGQSTASTETTDSTAGAEGQAADSASTAGAGAPSTETESGQGQHSADSPATSQSTQSARDRAGQSDAEQSAEAADDRSDDRTTGRVVDPIAKAREEDPDEEYVVRFFNERTGVGAIGNPTPQGALAGAIEYLCQERALDNYLSLPWGVKDGRALLTREPTHPDGTPMEPAHELDNGYYLWTAIGSDACRSTIKDLAENLGLRVMFQGDWD